jgi:DNA replication protein DnaC
MHGDVDHSPKRDIDKALFRQLATGRWIADHNNVIATGMTGVGKSYFACALGQLACRLGFRVAYKRVPRLFEELALAHADGSYVRLLARLAKVDVLILDDWALAPMNDQQRRDVLEILEDRHGARSTIVTSQLPVECVFRSHLGTRSGATWAVIPEASGHSFRSTWAPIPEHLGTDSGRIWAAG